MNYRAAIAFALAVLALILALIFASDDEAGAAPNLDPVIVIVMENKERSTIEGSAEADYLKAFEAGGRSFTQYYGVTHPSLPNYLAMASGSTQGKVGSNSISAGEIDGPTIWSQLSKQRIPWGVYMETMPSPCYSGDSSGDYVLRHNPAIPFASVFDHPRRCRNVVPYSSFSTTALPALSVVVPNLCNDMHDCSIATGDDWLQARVPGMLAAGATVVVTFDEGSSSTNGGGNIYTAVDGPGIDPSVDTATYNHYSLLKALERRYEVKRLGEAATATRLPLS